MSYDRNDPTKPSKTQGEEETGRDREKQRAVFDLLTGWKEEGRTLYATVLLTSTVLGPPQSSRHTLPFGVFCALGRIVKLERPDGWSIAELYFGKSRSEGFRSEEDEPAGPSFEFLWRWCLAMFECEISREGLRTTLALKTPRERENGGSLSIEITISTSLPPGIDPREAFGVNFLSLRKQ